MRVRVDFVICIHERIGLTGRKPEGRWVTPSEADLLTQDWPGSDLAAIFDFDRRDIGADPRRHRRRTDSAQQRGGLRRRRGRSRRPTDRSDQPFEAVR